MKKALVTIIRIYQRVLSPDQGFLRRVGIIKTGACVFYPTCSEYTIEAIEKYGIFGGTTRGVRRIFKCHPWQKNRIDPLV